MDTTQTLRANMLNGTLMQYRNFLATTIGIIVMITIINPVLIAFVNIKANRNKIVVIKL